MKVEEEKKEEDGNLMAAAPCSPKEQFQQTQDIIQNLYNISTSEFLTPSVGDAYSVKRDPHLRLRRTLTPSLNVGIPNYAEAQFMLSKTETTGKRLSLQFGVDFSGANGETKKKHFTMDAYAWGASEEDASVRVVTLHGISPGVSRTRWHKLGGRYDAIEAAGSSSKKVRFVALDWHSIDRSIDDDSNEEFLTCLPKHMIDFPSEKEAKEFIELFDSVEKQQYLHKLYHALSSGICPRSFDDGGRIFRAVIEEGLGWGTDGKPFIVGLKSWSGGLGMRMLAQMSRSKDGTDTEETSFTKNVQGAIIMHPGCFDKKDIVDAMSSGIIPAALMCWAKDDPRVPYGASQLYLDAASNSNDGDGTKVKLITYESGGHHNFDGSGGWPNFDDEVMDWIDNLP